MVRGIAIILLATGLAMGQAMVQHAAAAAGGAAAAAGSKRVADGLEKILGAAAASTATAAATPTPEAPAKVQQVTTAAPAPPTGRRSKRSPFEPQVNRSGGSEMAPVLGAGHGAIPSPTEVETVVTSGESVPGNPWNSRSGRTHSQPPQGPVPAFTPFVTNDAPVVSRGAGRRSATQVAEQGEMPVPAIALPTEVIAVPVLPPPPPPVIATPEKFAAIQEGATYEQILAELGTPASKIEMIEDGKVLESLRIEAGGNKLGNILMVNGIVTQVLPVAR